MDKPAHPLFTPPSMKPIDVDPNAAQQMSAQDLLTSLVRVLLETNHAGRPHAAGAGGRGLTVMRFSETRHPCAVCDTLIGDSYLMCLTHWKLVPHELQHDVYRTLALYRHADGGLAQVRKAQSRYHAARDAAIAAVQAGGGTTPTQGEAP